MWMRMRIRMRKKIRKIVTMMMTSKMTITMKTTAMIKTTIGSKALLAHGILQFLNLLIQWTLGPGLSLHRSNWLMPRAGLITIQIHRGNCNRESRWNLVNFHASRGLFAAPVVISPESDGSFMILSSPQRWCKFVYIYHLVYPFYTFKYVTYLYVLLCTFVLFYT